ncbi:hypothetical protein F4604DRAFT_1195537 [Suillus subluteus]|nr:hypothetical protein F4604DRAFT_1195537 [Suillus subluteus]
MSQPVTEDSKPDRTDQWAKLLPNVNWQFIPWRNLWFTSEGATSGKDSDDSKIVPNLTTSGTDTESRFIAESLSSSKDLAPPVEREDPHRDGDPPSLLTQPLLKMDVDLKKYCDGPRDLTHYITCTQGYPCSYGGFSGIWKCELESSQNGIEVRSSIALLSKC